jgi:hypothetical protein
MGDVLGVSVEALKGGSRRGRLPGLRVQWAKNLGENHVSVVGDHCQS